MAAALAAGVRRVVHVSSNSPFGANASTTDTFRNDEPYDPSYGYGRSKMRAELRVGEAVGRGLDAVIVRPPWFYGPFQPARQTTFFRLVRAGRFPVIGDGRQRRSMVYVDNLVQGIVLAELTRTAPGRAWWIADAQPYEVNEIVATVGRALRAEGLTVTPNRAPPAGSRRTTRGARRRHRPARRALRPAGPRPRRDGQHDRLRHLGGPLRARLRPRRGAGGGDATQHPLVHRAGPPAVTTSLVTGGNGYFGRLLVQRLAERGDDVRLLDVDVTGADGPGIAVIAADIRDAAAVRDAVDGVDVVYHNVAQVPLARDPHLLRTVNADGTQILLAACADAGVDKVVHTSSSAVFGVPSSNPVLPSTVPNPQEAYGHAKLAAEWACLRAAADGLDVTIVRPRTILGHGRLGIFGILFDWIADGADPIVLGDGSNRYQFIHADDLATVCLLAGRRRGTGRVQRRH